MEAFHRYSYKYYVVHLAKHGRALFDQNAEEESVSQVEMNTFIKRWHPKIEQVMGLHCMGLAGEWDWIGVGAGWPAGQLESKIDEHLKAGRRVFLDADPRWWLPCDWHLIEVRELAQIEPHFHFKQIAPTVYEIRPLDEQSAMDRPHLENLLPEKRPEEVKKCFNSG